MTTQKLESIIDLASVLARQSDFQEILRLITRKASVLFNAETALIMMVNPSTRETVKTIYRQGGSMDDNKFQLLHIYLTGWVIENDSGFVSEDVQNDKRFQTGLFKDIPVKSVVCSPFRSDGIIIGTLLLVNQLEDHVFGQNDFNLLEKLAAVVSPFLKNIQKIKQYFSSPMPEQSLIKKYESHGLLGSSEKYITLLQSIEAAAGCDVRVLLEGQSGTGKELVARAIHHCSSRASNNFIAIDCGAIPRDLIESELFGHTKGAFTSAGESRKGLMEEADGGTLFMDEITNLPLEIQAKLLRVLQEKEIRPLGSNQLRKIDVRIIAASSVSLKELVEKGGFREDLFFRLYVYPIEIPSLSQRKSDIPHLANHFLRKFSMEQKKQVEEFSGDLLEFLKNHEWSGNVRELENFIERLVTLTSPDMKTIDIGVLPSEFHNEWITTQKQKPIPDVPEPLRETLAAYEKKSILNALILCDWNQSKAARMLQISEHALRYKMKNLGITRQN